MPENLVVLCFDCHHLTQIRGGFDRKLDAAQIVKYRGDWVQRVASKRDDEHGKLKPATSVVRGTEVLKFIKLEETSAEHLYSFDAEYPLLGDDGSAFRQEINLGISAFVVDVLQRFRAGTIPRLKKKIGEAAFSSAAFDSTAFATGVDTLSLSHKVWIFSSNLLSIEFVVWSYYAGAAHPNRKTHTLNYLLDPPMRLKLLDIFDRQVDFLQVLSSYCIDDLHKQQPVSENRDEWITRGAGAKESNYQNIVFERRGIRVFFDEYEVGSYAEGRYEVVVPMSALPTLSKSMEKAADDLSAS